MLERITIPTKGRPIRRGPAGGLSLFANRSKAALPDWTLRRAAAAAGLWLLTALPAQALYISPDLEVLRIPNVGAAWQTVSTQNTYVSPVVVCTYNLPSNTDNEAIERVRNLTANSFQVRIQRPQDSGAVTASDVYCLVAENGVNTLNDGRQFEAGTVLSDGTNGWARGWGVGGVNGAEDVSAAIVGTYPPASQPTVLGQVMSFNDANFSAFWSFDCDSRSNVPFQSGIADGICVGKHVGQLSGTASNRANETLGYIIIDEGAAPTGSFGGISYRVDLGADTILGVGNTPPYSYALGASYDFAVATKEAEDGGQGGWAVLYGNAPLAGAALDLAVDEETLAGDTTRTHISEQFAYWVFRGTDRGDAPASYGDAIHNVSGLLSIGTLAAGDADAEAVQFSAAADADDLDQLDDEDGVAFRSPSGTGQSIFADVTISNRSGGAVTLCAWLDVPSGGTVDGTFDGADGQCQSTGATNPTLTFQWAGLPTDQSYSTFARFRLTSDAMTAANAAGSFSDGEVEDYQVLFDFRPTAATIGEVALQAEAVTEFLAALDIAAMDDGELLALLGVWDPAQAAALPPADRAGLLAALTAYLDPDGDGQVAVLRWQTLEERGTIGFYVERRAGEGPWTPVAEDMLPGLLRAPLGGEYQLADPQARAGELYQYRLIEQEATGATRGHGPYGLEMEP